MLRRLQGQQFLIEVGGCLGIIQAVHIVQYLLQAQIEIFVVLFLALQDIEARPHAAAHFQHVVQALVQIGQRIGHGLVYLSTLRNRGGRGLQGSGEIAQSREKILTGGRLDREAVARRRCAADGGLDATEADRLAVAVSLAG